MMMPWSSSGGGKHGLATRSRRAGGKMAGVTFGDTRRLPGGAPGGRGRRRSCVVTRILPVGDRGRLDPGHPARRAVGDAEERISRDATRGGAAFDAGEYDRGERAARLATVGFIPAPVAVVIGALAYWTGASLRRAERRATVGFAPTWASGGPGGVLAVSY